MTQNPDPFALYPGLRDLVTDPMTSTWRDFDGHRFVAENPKFAAFAETLYTKAERDTRRQAALARHKGGDLWVFAYGSLMWDPAFRFTEVRRAHAPHHARRFILRDTLGGRGTQDRPGLMAALDAGTGCDGLAFRIAQSEVEAETAILCARELAGPAYFAELIGVETAQGPLKTLTFLANHDAPIIAGDISRTEQIRCIATGCGFLGTSLAYLENIASHFAALRIDDAEVTSLLREVHAFCANQTEAS